MAIHQRLSLFSMTKQYTTYNPVWLNPYTHKINRAQFSDFINTFKSTKVVQE
jgi:hypothetical protein